MSKFTIDIMSKNLRLVKLMVFWHESLNDVSQIQVKDKLTLVV